MKIKQCFFSDMVRILLLHSPENGFKEPLNNDRKAKLKMADLLTYLTESGDIEALNYLQEALIAKNYGKPSFILGYSVRHYFHKYVCFLF